MVLKCTLPDNALYVSKFCKIISEGLRVRDSNSRVDARVSQFTKGHYSVKTLNGVMVLNLCTSSDEAL